MNQLPIPTRPFVFYGASELGRDALSVIEGLRLAGHDFDFRGFVDDGEGRNGSEMCGVPIVGGGDWLSARASEVACVMTIGAPAVRRTIVERLTIQGVGFVTLAHPTAVIGSRVAIGEGTLIMANVTTTVEIKIGRHVVINPACTLAHDVRIGDFSYLSPGCDLAGAAVLEEAAYLGTAAVVLPHRTIGAGSVLGAGGVAVQDVAPGVTAAGVPARKL